MSTASPKPRVFLCTWASLVHFSFIYALHPSFCLSLNLFIPEHFIHLPNQLLFSIHPTMIDMIDSYVLPSIHPNSTSIFHLIHPSIHFFPVPFNSSFTPLSSSQYRHHFIHSSVLLYIPPSIVIFIHTYSPDLLIHSSFTVSLHAFIHPSSCPPIMPSFHPPIHAYKQFIHFQSWHPSLQCSVV